MFGGLVGSRNRICVGIPVTGLDDTHFRIPELRRQVEYIIIVMDEPYQACLISFPWVTLIILEDF